MTDRRLPLIDDSGATAVEFAMIAAVLVLMVLVLMDLGRMFWTKATVQSVAEEVSRCYAVQKPQNDATLTCSTRAKAITYAQTLATQRGLPVGNGVALYDALVAAEKATAETNCGNATDMVSVVVTLSYTPILPISVMASQVEGKACFPIG